MIPIPLITGAMSLLGNWQRILVYAALAAALALTVWMHGYFKGKAALYEYQADQARAAVAIVIKQGAVTERVVTQWRTVDRVIEKQGEIIIREVPVHVTPQDDAACRIPDGFVRLWNDANTGGIPDPAGRADATPRRDRQPAP